MRLQNNFENADTIERRGKFSCQGTAALNEKINAVESAMADDKIKSEKLSELLARTENLIGEIQSSTAQA